MAAEATTNDPTGPTPSNGRRILFLCIVAPAEQGGTVSLEADVIIGRGEHCSLRVASGSTSREHASIHRDGPLWVVRDRESKNGVFVNGARVDAAPLEHGSVLRAGGLVGVVVEAAAAEARHVSELAPGLFGGVTLAAVARTAAVASSGLANIVLEAESGSGKERFARAIHDWSGRTGSFVAINCSALPAHLAEAELFGYQRGAFTGADRNREGYFKAAAGGTLFLDELLDLPLTIQPKLLRAVERKEVVPLGSTTPVPVDLKIVAASQVPLPHAVAEGRLRADLYSRLNGITIRVPPLRSRREDILPLFYRFLRARTSAAPALSPAAAEQLCLHDWPLNVRELEAVAGRVALLHGAEATVGVTALQPLLGLPIPARPPVCPKVEPEWDGFVTALKSKQGNVVRAAESVGISRQRAYRLLASHPELSVSELRRSS